MAAIEPSHLVVQGKQARVWRGGRGDALLLLHAGGGEARACWSRVWENLADDFEVIAPDWPGFGESEPMPRTTYDDLARWVEDLRIALKLKRIAIAGNSFGGTTARLYGAAYPARSSRLILINGGGYLHPASGRLPAGASLTPKPGMTPDEFFREMLILMFHDQSLLTPEMIAEQSAGSTRIFAILGQAIMGPAPSAITPRAPTLVLWGEGDRYVPPSSGEQVAAELPNAEFRLIANAGHMPQIERPDAVIDAMHEFLTR